MSIRTISRIIRALSEKERQAKRVLVITALLFAVPAYADNVGIQNEALSTLSPTAGMSGPVAMDSENRLIISPTGSTAGVQYDEGDTAATVTGTAVMWRTAGNAMTPVDTTNRLPVNVSDGSGALNVIVDSSALPSGASTLAEQQTQTTSLQLLDDAVATTAAAITTKGFAASGTDGTNARILKLDTSGEIQADILSVIPGTGQTNLGKAEDSAHASTDVGVGAMGVRTDTLASSAADGDYEFHKMDAKGAQWVNDWKNCTLATNTGNTGDQTIVAAPGAGNSLYLTYIFTSCDTTVTPCTTLVKIGGTTYFDIQSPINSGTGSQPWGSLSLPTPIKVGDNTGLVVNNSDNNARVTVCTYTAKTI